MKKMASGSAILFRANCEGSQLLHCGRQDFVHTNRSRGTGIVSSLVKKFLQERRNYFPLDTVIMDFPRAGTGENRDTWNAAPEREMHRQTVSGDETTMSAHVRQVIWQRRPLRQKIHDETGGFGVLAQLG